MDIIKNEKLLFETNISETPTKDFQTPSELIGKKKKENIFISVLCSVNEKASLVKKVFPIVTHVGGICIVYSNLV